MANANRPRRTTARLTNTGRARARGDGRGGTRVGTRAERADDGEDDEGEDVVDHGGDAYERSEGCVEFAHAAHHGGGHPDGGGRQGSPSGDARLRVVSGSHHVPGAERDGEDSPGDGDDDRDGTHAAKRGDVDVEAPLHDEENKTEVSNHDPRGRLGNEADTVGTQEHARDDLTHQRRVEASTETTAEHQSRERQRKAREVGQRRLHGARV